MEVVVLLVLSLLSVSICIGIFVLNELVNDIKDLRTAVDVLERMVRRTKNR